jgi:hypothetical protein
MNSRINPSENNKAAEKLVGALESPNERLVQQYGKTLLLPIPDGVAEMMRINDGDSFRFVIKDNQHLLLIKA